MTKHHATWGRGGGRQSNCHSQRCSAAVAQQSNGHSMAGAQAQAAPDPTMETKKQVHDGSEAARATEWEGKSTTRSYDKVSITSGWF